MYLTFLNCSQSTLKYSEQEFVYRRAQVQIPKQAGCVRRSIEELKVFLLSTLTQIINHVLTLWYFYFIMCV